MPTFKSFDAFDTFSEAVRFERRFAHNSECVRFLDDVRRSAKSRTLRRGHPLWRAQIGHGTGMEPISLSEDDESDYINIEVDAPFEAGRMSPDRRFVLDGRLNPRGIAYLYLAMDEPTAIAEVRPWLGADVSVGVFEVLRDCKIVDCSGPQNHGFLFGIAGDGSPIDPPEGEWDEIVWGRVSHAFAVPTDPHDSNLTYVPTQIIAEVIREAGYDGIAYQSAMHWGGKNVALFDASSANLFACELKRVRKIEYSCTTSGRVYMRPRLTETPPATPASK